MSVPKAGYTMERNSTSRANAIVPAETNPRKIEERIYYLRGERVMIDRDLAELYGESTKRLNQQVRRNLKRFPEDFMFQMNKEEFKNWKLQIATSNQELRGIHTPPLVFTEHGIAMLSSVLQSDRAIAVNIVIMRAFTRWRAAIAGFGELSRRIDELEDRYDGQFARVFDAIRTLMREADTHRNLNP